MAADSHLLLSWPLFPCSVFNKPNPINSVLMNSFTTATLASVASHQVHLALAVVISWVDGRWTDGVFALFLYSSAFQ